MLAGVTDTQALVWFASGQLGKLGREARKVFEAAERKDGSGLVHVPVIVLHEISSLLIGQRIDLGVDFAQFVRNVNEHAFYLVTDVTSDIVLCADSFKAVSDPFDRLIMGFSDYLETPLMSSDEAITDSHLVEIIWD